MNLNPGELLYLLNKEAEDLAFGTDPVELYEPIRYIMNLGGKRMRPMFTLFSYSLFKDNFTEILKPAMAVEVFHNFTLMHDDIMDQAPLRRGKPTVHEKWTPNIAILSGDVMFVKAYELFMDLDPMTLKRVLLSFNQCATEVCEGQQMDMNFEKIESVSEEDYLYMIRLKTAVLLGFSLELGAILAGASEENCQLLKRIGVNIGLGFQLKDDLLDVYADQNKFGKQVGGDIIANKKTFLLIKALQLADHSQNEKLSYWLNIQKFNKEEKVRGVTEIYNELDVQKITEEKMNDFFSSSLDAILNLNVPADKKSMLHNFAKNFINRES